MSMKEELIEKIQNKTLTMGVCGLGYVGLPLAVDKAKHGFRTIGFDVQRRGHADGDEIHITHLGEIRGGRGSGKAGEGRNAQRHHGFLPGV